MQPCRKGSGGVGWKQAEEEPAVCPDSHEGHPHLGVHQRQHSQLVKRSNFPTGYCVQIWALQFKKVLNVLECVQKKAVKLGRGLGGMSSEERLSTMGLSSLEIRRPSSDLLALSTSLSRGRGE